MAIKGKATPTMVKVTVFVTVNRDAYAKEYSGEVPSKADLIDEVRETVQETLGEGRLGKQDSIFSVSVL